MTTETMTERFVDVGRVSDFPEGRGKRVEVEGKALALFHVDGQFYALVDRCTHGQAPLSRGTVQERSVICPRHGARFDLATGTIETLQAVENVETHAVEIRDGRVRISTRGRLAEPLWIQGRRLDEGK